MKLAVISDIHDNLANLAKCLAWCTANDTSELICCGDVTNEDTIKFLAENFPSTIYLVRGNVCNYNEKILINYPNILNLGRGGGTVSIDNKKIGICHEPWLIDGLIKNNKPAVVFYGHTHKPWFEERAGVKLVNPGTLAGMFQKATFALYNTGEDKLELKVIEQL